MKQVNVGMIGGGTVGSGVWHALEMNGELMARRTGVEVRIVRVAVKAVDEPRPYKIPTRVMVTDWEKVVRDPKVEVVVELMGGTGLAKAVVLTALSLGKPVVTANKALISEFGPELFRAAERAGTNLYYEASVAGGIPIIKAMREALVGNRFVQLHGIVNGTCNYILTRMRNERAEFEAILKDAQKLGYAEAEPSLDVDGFDAMHKTHILASLAHGFWVDKKKILVEGIRAISQTDIQFAEKLGYVVKLLGIVKAGGGAGGGKVQVSVYPALVPQGHVLASVNDVFNAVFVRGDVVGDTLFYGRGAGKDATASAVLSDLADVASDLANGTKRRVPAFVEYGKGGKLMPSGEGMSQYYIRIGVADRAGVLARVAAIFGKNKISISSVVQPESGEGAACVPLIVMTHRAQEELLQRALREIGRLPEVKAKPVVLRVEHFD